MPQPAAVKLLAISDLHLGHRANREALDDAAGHHPDDWLIVAGDVGERPDHLRLRARHCSAAVRQGDLDARQPRSVVPAGRHGPHAGSGALRRARRDLPRRGVADAGGSVSSNGPATPGTFIVPMFLLFDYTLPAAGGSASTRPSPWARESGVVSGDEQMLEPAPWPSIPLVPRALRRHRSASRRAARATRRTILVNHWPLRYDLARPPRVPRFSVWCGTTRTEDWARRFRARAVVSGHLHLANDALAPRRALRRSLARLSARLAPASAASSGTCARSCRATRRQPALRAAARSVLSDCTGTSITHSSDVVTGAVSCADHMKKLRVLVLMHDYLVPPDDVTGHDPATARVADRVRRPQDAARRARARRARARRQGRLAGIRQANDEFKPHIAFNLLEAFHEVGTFDQNVVSYLELLRLPYTGCNPRGMLLARDKALSKKLLQYHRVPVPEFVDGAARPQAAAAEAPDVSGHREVADAGGVDRHLAGVGRRRRNEAARARAVHPRLDHAPTPSSSSTSRGGSSTAASSATSALQVLPVWEMTFANMPEDQHRIATERVKWNAKYQAKMGIATGEAKTLRRTAVAERVQHIARRAYKVLELSGYARIDLRLDAQGRVHVLEANPNPQIARTEDFAASAAAAGLAYPALLQRILTTGLRWEPERLG